ncbi:phage baseplate upper protein [Clostridium gasigenes]|uniref:phage baseplate upper protein n=1 Tax=Clostridium gasigenes TaxID=94869 RepID=UPI001C0C26C8|nr:phage baseplate upper protein [Clostridium gasigenes]MBU3107132.1 phage baseplate upper protein [Clostridium gasigenes]
MIKFDKSRKKYEIIKKKQYDTLEKITVSFYNNNIPINLNEYTFRLECLKADNTIVIQMDNIVIKNINELEILLIPQITIVSGEAKCQIVLFKNGLQDSTFTFYIDIGASVLQGGVVSGSVITILDTLIKKIAEANTTNTTLINTINTANITNTNLISKTTTANSTNTTLTETNTTATNTNKTLVANTTLANASNANLTATITTANTSNTTLNTTIATANAANINLTAKTTTATTTNTALTVTNTTLTNTNATANTLNTTLITSTTNANAANTNLNTTITNSNAVKIALDNSIAKGNLALKQDITDTNLMTKDKTIVGGINELKNKIGDFRFLNTTIKTDVVDVVNELSDNTGNLNHLLTVEKKSTVGAINELDANKVSKTDFVANNNGGTTTGTATTYILTLLPAPIAYVNFMSFTILPNVDSGLTPTLNVNGLGAKPIINRDGTALAVSALKTGLPCYMMYINSKFYFN